MINSYVDHQYTYDTLGRLNYTTLNFKSDATVKVDYTYANAANRTDSEGKITYITSQISKEEIGDRGYAYTYDKVGNITKITEKKTASGSYSTKVQYTYDALGQLTRENNVDLNKTIVYTYDGGGNITKRTEYPYTTGTVGTATKTISYTYDSTWKDKLTKYDGDSITYDAIGNPKTYRDGMSFTWQGRQMKTAKTTSGTSVSYKYNADGLRTYKKVGSTVHQYEYSGDKLFYEKRGDIKFYYRYDVNGNLMSITRLKANGDKFTLYAVCNSRGDIEELRKESGALYARYVYDSWGNVLHIYSGTGTTEITDTANLAIQNPFRYRGYYYDAEIGLYYLQSRYYDPVTGRFVSADGQISGVGGDILGYNLYSYCQNDPVNACDSEGEWPSWAKKAVAAVAVVAAVDVVAAVTVATAGSGTVAACLAIGAAKGAAIGMATGAVTGAATGAVSHRLKTGSWNGAGKAALEEGASGALTGAITGAITGAATSNACFIAGTSVCTFFIKKSIENIKSGDYVWATNPETGETELKEVVQTFINETDELVYVKVNGEDIVTTPEHPFYVFNHGWIGAIDLKAGDKLVLVNGEFAVVESVQHEILEQPIKVYNFEVEDFHTYYVGNSGVLVHNACSSRNTAVKKAWKNEFNNVKSGGNGVTRQWSPLEKVELLKNGKVSGYQGHHIKSVRGFPEFASDPQNIQFLTRSEHLQAHGGNWRNITSKFFVLGE